MKENDELMKSRVYCRMFPLSNASVRINGMSGIKDEFRKMGL